MSEKLKNKNVTDFKQFLPKNKDDIESIRKLQKYAFKDIEPFAMELFKCLQDMNWPIARPVADYLRPFLDKLTIEILEIFRSEDHIWKYWVINEFFVNTDWKANQKLIDELIRMRDNPKLEELEDEVNVIASLALDNRKNIYKV